MTMLTVTPKTMLLRMTILMTMTMFKSKTKTKIVRKIYC